MGVVGIGVGFKSGGEDGFDAKALTRSAVTTKMVKTNEILLANLR